MVTVIRCGRAKDFILCGPLLFHKHCGKECYLGWWDKSRGFMVAFRLLDDDWYRPPLTDLEAMVKIKELETVPEIFPEP